jgi:hypothetical protein
LIFKRLYISTLLPKTVNRKQISERLDVSEFLQFIGLRLVEPTLRRAYASERRLGLKSGKRSILQKICIYIL